MKGFLSLFFIFIFVSFFTGCVSYPKEAKKSPKMRMVGPNIDRSIHFGTSGDYPAGYAPKEDPPERNTFPNASFYAKSPRKAVSSLWRENHPAMFFVDHKARNLDDIITIKIVESSSASKNATTKTSRKSTLKAGIDKFFNLEKSYPSSHPFFNPFSGVEGGLENDFDGSGATSRSGKLTASITARVAAIFPNGNLGIEGRREITVNHEKQFIIISGTVRPEDISPENVVLSTYIADAKIFYTGKGLIADKQTAGWMTKAFDMFWPF